MTTFVSALSQKFLRLWRRLVEPSKAVHDLVAQQKSRLLASISIVLLIGNVLLLPAFIIVDRDPASSGNRVVTVAAGLVLLTAVYFMSRRGWYRIGGLLSVGVGTALIFGLHFVGGGVTTIEFDYLVVMTVFSTLFFSAQISLILFVIHLVLMLGIAITNSNISLAAMVEGPIAFNALTVSMIIGFSLYRDRVERLQQRQLSISEQRYRAVTELISDYAYYTVFEPNGGFRQEWITVDSFERLTGYHAEDRPNQKPNYLYHPDEYERLKHDLDRVRAGEQFKTEYRIINAEGHLRWLSIFRRPEFDPKTGLAIGFYGVAQDVTEQKQAEAVARQAERLQVALEKEQELGDAKNKMMVNILHEFRTPLATIQSSAELMRHYHDKMSASQREERLTTIGTQVTQLATLLNDINFIMHNTFRSAEIQLDTVNLNSLCQTLMDEAKRRSSGNLVFECEGDVALNEAVTDVRLFSRILDNLLNNAAKFSPNGGTVRVSVRRLGDQLVLCVEDDGIGIAPVDQRRIFEPFFRGSNADEFAGTGLGLSIVHDCVTLLGGTIQVESELNRRTGFTVSLPLRESLSSVEAGIIESSEAVALIQT